MYLLAVYNERKAKDAMHILKVNILGHFYCL